MATRSLTRDLTDTGLSNGQQEEDALLESPNNRTGTQDEKEDGDGDDRVSPYFRFFVVLNREIIQKASRHSLTKKFQENMLINTAGTSVVPIGFLCFLIGLFTAYVFVLPVYFTASLPRVIKQAFREGGWCQALLATGIGVLFSMSMLSPLIVYYMHFVNDSLYDLVCNNVLSGMDVNMPLCFPLFVAGSMAMQTAEYCMTERLFRNMMDEYDDDSMFDANSTLVNTTDLRNMVDKMNEHLRDKNDRPLFEFSYFIEIKTDEFGSFVFSGDEGQMYIEKCAERLITLSRIATSVTLPTWLKFLLPLVALLTASIGPSWMYFKHSGQYLAHASSVPIVVFSISFFLTFMMTFSVLLLVWCRLEFLDQVHRQIAVLLYLSATDIGRRLVSLSCVAQLDTVFVRSPEASEPVRLTASDPSLKKLTLGALFPPVCYTVEAVEMLVDEMRRKRLFVTPPLPPDVTKDNEFKSIAAYLFIEMRRWIKIRVTVERLPVQNVALGLLLVTASATVMTIASTLFWQRLTAAAPVCLFVALLFGALFISLLNSVILLNTVLQETTSSMISQWVDKVKKEWLKRQIDLKVYVLESEFSGELNHDCVKNMQVDNYFRTVLEPLRQYMEEVRTGEKPLQFFGVGVSLAWRSQLIAALFTAAASAVWTGLASYRDEIKDVATTHILVMANASTPGGANASSVL